MDHTNNIIQFYKEQVYIDSMREPNELTNDEIRGLSNTLWFASWMLSIKYKECVDSIKHILKRM